MKVAILTSAHPTDDVRVMTKIANSFLVNGHQVAWYGIDHSFFETNREPQIEWHLQPRVPGWKGRLSSLVSSARGLAQSTDIDWIYTPDPDAAIAALLVSKRCRARTIFDIHEDFHNGLLRRGISNPTVASVAGKLVRSLISLTARASDVTVAVSQGLIDTYSTPGPDAFPVINSAPASLVGAPGASKLSHKLVVMHGKAASGNGTPMVIKALRELAPDGEPEVMFISTPGPDRAPFDPAVAEELSDPSLAPVTRIVSGVPHAQMSELYSQCGAGLISYGRVLGEASLPNRLFEYMAAGLAVLAPNYSPEIVRVLEEHKCGITADFEDPTDIAAKLRSLAQNPDWVRRMGAAGRKAFIEYYAWESQASRLISRLEALDGTSSPKSRKLVKLWNFIQRILPCISTNRR